MVDPVAEWEPLRMQAVAQGFKTFSHETTKRGSKTRSEMVRRALMPMTSNPDENLVEWLTRHMPSGFKFRVEIDLIRNTISCEPKHDYRDSLIDYPIGKTHPLG